VGRTEKELEYVVCRRRSVRYVTALPAGCPPGAGGGYGDGRVSTRTVTPPATVTFVVVLLGCWAPRLAMGIGKATTSWIILVRGRERTY